MLPHHQESLTNFIEVQKSDPDVSAIVLIGSIARKTARQESDIDVIVIVTEDYYSRRRRSSGICEVNFDLCTYQNGYLDIKYFTEKMLRSIASKGSEPARYAFTDAKLVFTNDEKWQGIIGRIPVFQEKERPDKMLSFYSAFNLGYAYYWQESNNNPYLRARCVADIALFGARLLLQDSKILFPSQKGLARALERLPYNSEPIIEVFQEFVSAPNEDTLATFKKTVLDNIKNFEIPSDISTIVTRHVDDNELWWFKKRPLIAEW